MGAMAVARKEWREIVRDRRSLYSGLFFGVWGPLVMGIALLATARHQGELGAIEIGGQGASQAPALAAFLAARDVSIVEIAGDPAAAIRDRRMPALLIVDDDYAERFAQSRPATVARAARFIMDGIEPACGAPEVAAGRLFPCRRGHAAGGPRHRPVGHRRRCA